MIQIETTIDTLITACLEIGQIRISERNCVYCAVLINQKNEVLYRTDSDRGVLHALGLLIASILENSLLEHEVTLAYPRSLTMRTETYLDTMVLKSYIRICLNGSHVQIDHHYAGMKAKDDVPGSRTAVAIGTSFSNALVELYRAPTTLEDCVRTPL